MKITILTVGKLGRMVEAQLALDYASRATASGRALALGPVDILEVEARKPGKAAEAEVLRPHLEGAYVVACDEHGKAWKSRAFADHLARLRDDGNRRVVFLIGAVALLAAHLGTGLMNAERLAFSATLVLPAFAGMLLGYRVQDRLDQAVFRRWTQGLLVLTGLNLVRQAFF